MGRASREPHSTAGKRFELERLQETRERTALVKSLYIRGLRGVTEIAELLGVPRRCVSADLKFLEMEGQIPLRKDKKIRRGQ